MGIGISINQGGNTNITDGDKGDITVSSSGASWLIDNEVVTNSKLSKAKANSFKANLTNSLASSSDVDEDDLISALPDSLDGIVGFDTATKQIVRFPASKLLNVQFAGTVTSSLAGISVDSMQLWYASALSQDITFGVPLGTPTESQQLRIRLKDNGTSRTITWNSIFQPNVNIPLPTNTNVGETLYLTFIFNGVVSKWELISSTQSVGSNLTNAEIRTAVENASDSNVFTDADHTKLNGIESGSSASPLTTKGDLYAFDTTKQRLPVGTNGQTLVVDSSEAIGLKWKNLSETPAVGGGLLVDLGMANTNQVITVANGSTIINFDDTLTGAIDKNGDWDNTNKKFVVSSTSGNGTYQFEVNLFCQNSTAGYYNLQAFVNGSIKTPNGAFAMSDAVDDSGFDGVSGTISLDLVVGDEVEIKLQSYVATTTISANGTWNFTQGMRISKASGIKGEKGDTGTGAPISLNKTFTLQNPTTSNDITIFRTDVAITVLEVIGCSTGTNPTTTYQLKHHTDRSNSGNALTTSSATTSTTTGDIATLSDDTIPQNSWIWIETTAKGGTDVFLTIDIRYTED